jgi:hypothetical protein
MTYECSICHDINHVSRLHCKTCGTIPAIYSIIGRPASSQLEGIEVVSAVASERPATRIHLRTVTLDYYGEK